MPKSRRFVTRQRPRNRRRARQTATSSTPHNGRQRRRLPRDLRKAARTGGTAARVSRRRRAHLVQQRVVQDQRRARSACRVSPRCPDTSPDRSISAPCTSVPIRTSSSAPTTMRSTARCRASRSSSARCRRRSIRRVAPPGKHLMSMFTQYAPYELARRTVDRRAAQRVRRSLFRRRRALRARLQSLGDRPSDSHARRS